MRSWLMISVALILMSSVTEALVQGSMNFYYDPVSEYFLCQVVSKCYIAPLTRQEKDHVYSRQGIEDLELTYVREWLGALNETLVYHTDPNLPVKFGEMCRDKDIFYINRVLPPTATVTSIFG